MVKDMHNYDGDCTFESERILVLRGPQQNPPDYVEKTTNQGNPNKFFPDNWTPHKIVDIAVIIYNECKAGNKDVCMKNYRNAGCHKFYDQFSIMIYTDGQVINSVFPTDRKDCTCDYNKIAHHFD